MGYCGYSVWIGSVKWVDKSLSISWWPSAKDYLRASHTAAFQFLFVLLPFWAGTDAFCHSLRLKLNMLVEELWPTFSLTRSCRCSGTAVSIQPQHHAPAIHFQHSSWFLSLIGVEWVKCHFPDSLLLSHQVPITTLGAAYHCSWKILQGTAECGPQHWFVRGGPWS